MPGGIMIPSRNMSPAIIGGIAYAAASSSSSALSLGQNLLDGQHHQLPAMALQQHHGQQLADQHQLPQQQQQAVTSESNARGPRGGGNADELEMSKSGGSDNLEGGGSGEEQDPNQRPRKKRYHRHTQHQIQELEAFFKECPHPDDKQRKELSRELGLEPLQVKFWFQNKRTQTKKIKGGIKSEFGGLASGKSRTHRRPSLPSVVSAPILYLYPPFSSYNLITTTKKKIIKLKQTQQ